MKFHGLKKENLPVNQYHRQAKMIVDELAASRNPMPIHMFNATVFANLGEEYNEIVSACSLKASVISFLELLGILANHEARVQMRNPSPTNIAATLVHALSIMVNQTGVSDEHRGFSSGGRSGFRGRSDRGRNGRGSYQQQRRDPCPVCGLMGHSPYKCPRRHQGPSLSENEPAQSMCNNHNKPSSSNKQWVQPRSKCGSIL